MHIQPSSFRLHWKELFLIICWSTSVKLHSVVFELDLATLRFTHDTETNCDIRIICMKLELIVILVEVMLHKYSRDLEITQRLVEILMTVRFQDFLDLFYQRQSIGYPVWLVWNFCSLTIQSIGRFNVDTLRWSYLFEKVFTTIEIHWDR